MKFFGEPYPSRELSAPIYETGEEVDTPVGEFCQRCENPIEEGDTGFMLPQWGQGTEVLEFPWHRRCLLEATLGKELADIAEEEVRKGNIL